MTLFGTLFLNSLRLHSPRAAVAARLPVALVSALVTACLFCYRMRRCLSNLDSKQGLWKSRDEHAGSCRRATMAPTEAAGAQVAKATRARKDHRVGTGRTAAAPLSRPGLLSARRCESKRGESASVLPLCPSTSSSQRMLLLFKKAQICLHRKREVTSRTSLASSRLLDPQPGFSPLH